ncbi:DUF4283 domain protein [Medicago truncatula]|uniref:DUF4283 domain protein n=1 Tax=Medicago truncatula TaxID=3880 RepID=G7J1W8_MEDTR|nr:DUF4283 domain protein [Medicago truncatula]
MAYTCPWPCVFDTVPSAVAQSVPSATMQTISGTAKGCFEPLSIRICHDEYHRGVEECKNAIRARLTLNKGDKSYFARDLSTKIGKHWKTSATWKMVPLGKGYYNFHFDLADDLRKIWATYFKYLSQKQAHVSLWIRLVELPQEYWRERTLKEIASTVGTPIDIDGPTRNHTFGHYARILVDIDLSKRAYDEILVEREGFALNVETAPPKLPRQNNDVGASTSANASALTWVPVMVASLVANTQRVPVSITPTLLTSLALTTVDISAPSPTLNANSQLGQVVTSTVATSQTDVSTLSSNSFRFPLHNVFDIISPDELPRVTPVLKVVSPVVHDDVHSEREERLHQTSQGELENPTVNDVTVTLSDDVEHNHSNPRELVESPKGSHC